MNDSSALGLETGADLMILIVSLAVEALKTLVYVSKPWRHLLGGMVGASWRRVLLFVNSGLALNYEFLN